MAARRQSPPPKRVLALKRPDGEPLTRADIQYDVLKAIFSDTTPAFSDPYNTSENSPKLCFKDLYIKAIMHSSKATKALRDKMTESETFAEDFAMLSLLVNVGRINTTMSFFPEMKTTIRTYHPIPTLQRTAGNMQDAPRIKHILKQGLLDREAQDVPSKPDHIMERARKGHIPSTSVLNLMFVLSAHTAAVGSFFAHRFDFLDVFLKRELSSASRARAFLWICFNYLENPGSATDDYDEEEKPNPFAEPTKNAAPFLATLTEEERLLENVDTAEEQALAKKLLEDRDKNVKAHAAKEAEKGETKVEGDDVHDQTMSALSDSETKQKGRKKVTKGAGEKSKRTKVEKTSRKEMLKKDAQGSVQGSTRGSSRDGMSIDGDAPDITSTATPRLLGVNEDPNHSSYRILPGKEPDHRQRGRHRYSPYPVSPDLPPSQRPRVVRHFVPERTMLEHAWHIINTTDPLVDSDDERGDEHDRHDYMQRLRVVTRMTEGQWNVSPHALQRSVEPFSV